MCNPFKARGYFRRIVLSFLVMGLVALLHGEFRTLSARAQTPISRPIRLASTPWTPFTNEPGKARFALEIVQAALQRAGYTVNTTIIEEGKLTSALLNKEYDGSAALWKDSEREKTLLYSKPYLENRLILVGRKGSDVSATQLSALKGKRVALVETYAYGDAISTSGGPTFVRSASEEDSVQKVLSNDAEYTLIDELVEEYILKNYPDKARNLLDFGSTPLIVRTLHFAVRKDLPNAATIIDKFNSQLQGMITDHTYNRLLQLNWIQADVDGDGKLEYVPISDQAGTVPPNRSYKIITIPSTTTTVSTSSPGGFYVGGKLYQNWSTVPDQFKLAGPNDTVTGGTKFSIFNFNF